MNNTIKGIFIFSIGAVIGSLASWKFFEAKYSKIAEEEIASIKEVYTYKKPDQEEIKEDDKKPDVKDISEYKNIVKREGYSNHSKGETKEEDNTKMITHPYIIDPDEFGRDYDTVSLTYYADGVLEDDFDGVIDDPEELVGDDYMNHFGEYEEDSVFVRNDEKQIDYEICRDNRTYPEVNGDNERWAAGN